MDTLPTVADHPPMPMTLDELLERGRSRIERLSPREAYRAALGGALIVDIRSDADREHTGVVPGSVHVPRTVLEWRLAPDSRWRNPHVAARPAAAADLRPRLLVDPRGGDARRARLARAGDVVGGIEAWLAEGLPTMPATRRRVPPALAGMDPPDRVTDRSAARSRRLPTSPLTLRRAGRTLAAMSGYDEQLVSFERRLRELELELADLRRTRPAPAAATATVERPPPRGLRRAASAARAGQEAPLPPPRAFELPPEREPFDLSRLLGARTLAFTGGLVSLLGIVFFFALAVQRGWIGPVARVSLGALASAAMLGAGWWLRRRFGETLASTAAAGVGVAGAYATLLAAAARYELIAEPVALVLAAGIAAACDRDRARLARPAARGPRPRRRDPRAARGGRPRRRARDDRRGVRGADARGCDRRVAVPRLVSAARPRDRRRRRAGRRAAARRRRAARAQRSRSRPRSGRSCSRPGSSKRCGAG